jgi:hypothetical protein
MCRDHLRVELLCVPVRCDNHFLQVFPLPAKANMIFWTLP